MRQHIKRDWEIVRIFFILAILTVGFVWVVQGLILTPAAPAITQNSRYVSSSVAAVVVAPQDRDQAFRARTLHLDEMLWFRPVISTGE